MTTAHIIFKVRKELDHYQAHTWKLIEGWFNEDKARSNRDFLISRLTPSEVRAGWTFEYQSIDIPDLPKGVEEALEQLSKLQP